MKKIFTTLLMMGVALTGWATITAEYAEGTKTLTIKYVDDGNSEDQNFSISNTGATTIKLTGDWSNKDLAAGGKIEKIFEQCVTGDKKVFLDLSGCNNMRSSVKYTGEGEADWTSNNFIYLPDSNYPETVTVTGTARESAKYYYSHALDSNGNPYSWAAPGNGIYVGEVTENGGNYYDQNGQPLVKKSIYVDENDKELPSDATVTDNGNNNYSYSYTYTPPTDKFILDKVKGKINGLAFPNNANFTAIPEKICIDMDALENVTFGDNLVWVGNSAFKNCSKLNNVTFPQTVKVIGLDAFCGCQKFTVVDLRIRDLVKVDAAAFNMVDVAKNDLKTVYLPLPGEDGKNTTLKFFANQVFASSHITELDFSYFYGIDHFAYDGEEHFGETVPSGISDTNRTFTWLVDLKKITLPPNLRHVGKECFYCCFALEEVVFKGEAVYENCELTNPLTIGDMAFKTVKDGEKWSKLTSVTFSNNVTVIGVQAFMDAPLTEVTIPASIVEIKTQAFATKDPGTIKTITFEEIDKTKYPSCNHAATTIAKEAFNHQTVLTDVYVNCDINIDCAKWAFDHNVTFSQGNVAIKGATLHFPKGREAHYTNLEHVLTNEIAENPKDFQAWLVEHLAVANNGWQEFVNAGPSSIDPQNPDPTYEGGLVLRTFSDPQYARIVPAGLRAYIVNKVTGPNANGFYELTLKRLQVIPAETGVILFGQPNSKDAAGNAIISMTPVNFNGEPLRRDYWDINGEENKNYLMPIIKKAHIRTSNATVEKDFTTVSSYEYEGAKTNVTFRNFALNRFDQTTNLIKKFENDFNIDNDNYAGFFRILPGTYSEGLAFLHLTATEYTQATGGEIIVNVDQKYNEEYDKDGNLYDPNGTDDEGKPYPNPRGWWTGVYKWDNRTLGWGTRGEKFNVSGANQFLGELEDADGIVKLVVPATNTNEGDIYNLQGVKVTNPTKGVYVRNGKKFVIK